MGEIGLLIAGWDRRTGWDGGGMEVPMLAVVKGAPSLSIEVRRATGSGGNRWIPPIASVLQGHILFVLEQ